MIHRESLTTWTVVVVDDEPDSIEVVTDVLEFHGARVHSTSNGHEALDLATALKPTFILTDLSMPGMDGWALLSHLKKNPALMNIPVIALTAHAMTGDAERVLAAGFTGYLSKPLAVMTLISDIKQQLPALVQQDNGKVTGQRV